MTKSTLKIAGWLATWTKTDDEREAFRAGAFKDCLQSLCYFPMLRAHDATDVVGRWDTLEETSFGLWVEGVVFDPDLAYLIENHAIRGLSPGFNTDRDEQIDSNERKKRTIIEATLKEGSIVSVPMNDQAMIMWTDKWRSGPSKTLLKCQVGGSTHATVVNSKARMFDVEGTIYHGEQTLPSHLKGDS